MQQQQRGAFRRFLVSSPGRALLIAATILLVTGAFYVQELLAIPVFLFFGLAVPIWVGLKGSKYLALSGLVVILLVPLIAGTLVTQEVLAPIPAAASATGLPFSNGTQPLMQNASVSPYVGDTSTNFTWQVTIYPQYLPYANSSLRWLTLFVSGCPGATGSNDSNCPSGYPFWTFNDSRVANATAPISQTFHFVIGSNGIWDWQMEIAYRNGTAGNITYQLLVGDPMYNGLEGPVVGTFLTVYAALLLTLYEYLLLILALPFYLLLLLYMWYKAREQRKKDTARRAAGPAPDEAGTGPPGSLPPPSGGSGAAGAAAAAASERACPSCGAVVYPNESTCWKCGATLTGPTATPLPSRPNP